MSVLDSIQTPQDRAVMVTVWQYYPCNRHCADARLKGVDKIRCHCTGRKHIAHRATFVTANRRKTRCMDNLNVVNLSDEPCHGHRRTSRVLTI